MVSHLLHRRETRLFGDHPFLWIDPLLPLVLVSACLSLSRLRQSKPALKHSRLCHTAVFYEQYLNTGVRSESHDRRLVLHTGMVNVLRNAVKQHATSDQLGLMFEVLLALCRECIYSHRWGGAPFRLPCPPLSLLSLESVKSKLSTLETGVLRLWYLQAAIREFS